MVYFKKNEAPDNLTSGARLHYLEDDSTYILLINSPQSEYDIGIWDEQNLTDLPSYYKRTTVFFNNQFEYISHLILPPSGNASVDFRPIGRLDSTYYFKGFTANGNNSSFHSDPPLTTSQPTVYSNNLVFGYDLSLNSLAPVNHWANFSNGNTNLPYNGYSSKMNFNRNIDIQYSAALTNSQTIVSTADLYDGHTHNWENEYQGIDGHRGYLWSITDLTNDETIVVPVISENGNVVSRSIYYSPEEDAVFRIGMVRGNDVPVSPSGPNWVTSPNDSAYYTFMTRESPDGNQEWSLPIYGFTNTNSDTVVSPDFFNFTSSTVSFVELQSSIFFSHTTFADFSTGDTIFMEDVFGSEQTYTSDLPDENVAFSSKAMFKISTSGQALAKLSFDLDINPNHVVGATFGNGFREEVFKVGDKLAWINYHENDNNSVATFKREMAAGDVQLIEKALPTGKSISISWLDENLEFIDFWTIPFVSDYSIPSIEYIGRYSGDTLLIQGNTWGPTSSSFDPSGLADDQETTFNSTFFAFYSAPEVLSVSDPAARPLAFSVYPNPGKDQVIIHTTLSKGEVTVFDIQGRQLLKSNFTQNKFPLQVENLQNGLYLISIRNGKDFGVQKFLKQ